MATIQSSIVEVCVFSVVNSVPHYLMLRRSQSEPVYPDIWQFVSGSIERGETALAASLRELKEETGFVPVRFWNVPYMNTFLDAAKDIVHISAVFAAQVPPNSQPFLSKEHYQFEWCGYERAQQLLVWPGQVRAIQIIHDYIVQGKQAAALTEIQL
jgi:dATP pyrophosphohydrolase